MSEILNNVEDTSQKTEQTRATRRIKKAKFGKKKKPPKSFMGKAFRQTKKPHIVIFIFELLLCFILDILRIIKNLILGIIVIAIICAVIACTLVLIKIKPIYNEYKDVAESFVENSTENTFRISESSYIYNSDGEVIAKLKANKDSTYLEFEEIPVEVIDAFVAVEDRTFWDNPGIDVKGLVRVGVDFIKTKGEEMHGASTITQQLARNIFLTHEVSLERKAKEMLISLEMTKKYSKRDIMEFYVNDICFANAYYGIEAASIGYFNRNANELTLSEIAYLCAIPNSPEYYNPYKNPERAVVRRDKILGDMLELNYISQQEYNEAVAQEIVITPPEQEFNNFETTYAIDCAVKYLMKLNDFKFQYEFEKMSDYRNYLKKYNEAYEIAKNQLYSGGYKVYTTLDSDKQAELQEILNDVLSVDESKDEETGLYKLQGAVTAIDNGTGKVVAIIGGRTGDSEVNGYSLNRAFQSPRQPGSSIKPLVVYAPAMENGYRPSTVVPNISVEAAKEKDVDINTLTGENMTIRKALELSKNGVAWKIFTDITPKVGLKYITNMEFEHIVPDDYYSAACLGGLTYGVTTVEMAGAYSALANHGEFRPATCIDKMVNKHGKDIYLEPSEKQVYKKRSADETIDMMKGVLVSGTAARLGWSKSSKVEAAAKTGTTNSNKDGWLCGTTPYYTVAVWVGYDTPKQMTSLQGATYPGQVWKRCMLAMLDGIEVGQFINAEYGEEDNIKMPEAYYEYLPGRDDTEVLSSGYTVGDYRNDRLIGEDVDRAIKEMQSINRASENSLAQIEAKRAEAQSIIESIYSQKFTAEKQGHLDAAYNQIINEINGVQPPEITQ